MTTDSRNDTFAARDHFFQASDDASGEDSVPDYRGDDFEDEKFRLIPFSSLRWLKTLCACSWKTCILVKVHGGLNELRRDTLRHKVTTDTFILKSYFSSNSSSWCDLDDTQGRALSKVEKIVQSQLRLMRISCHPNICSPIKVYWTAKAVSFLFENSGEMLMKRRANGAYSVMHNGLIEDSPEKIACFREDAAREIFKQIIKGLAHLHSLNYCHSDVKPSNIVVKGLTHAMVNHITWNPGTRTWEPTSIPSSLLSLCHTEPPKESTNVKLIDFEGLKILREGLSVGNGETSHSFIPPESVSQLTTNGISRDLWASGCALFIMLTGHHPIIRGKYTLLNYYHDSLIGNFPTINLDAFPYLTESVQSLLRWALGPLNKRPVIAQILAHEWMRV